MTRMPAARHVAARRLMRSMTGSASGLASGESATKQFCTSILTSARDAGTTAYSTMSCLDVRDTARRFADPSRDRPPESSRTPAVVLFDIVERLTKDLTTAPSRPTLKYPAVRPASCALPKSESTLPQMPAPPATNPLAVALTGAGHA